VCAATAKTPGDLVKEMEEKKMVLNRKVCLPTLGFLCLLPGARSGAAFITAEYRGLEQCVDSILLSFGEVILTCPMNLLAVYLCLFH